MLKDAKYGYSNKPYYGCDYHVIWQGYIYQHICIFTTFMYVVLNSVLSKFWDKKYLWDLLCTRRKFSLVSDL